MRTSPHNVSTKPRCPKLNKKPVTLIVGIICKDGIVIAADSQTTKGQSKLLGANKINVIEFANGKAAVAESGSILSNVVIEALQNKARGTEIVDELTIAKTAESAVREVIAGITQHLNPESLGGVDRQKLLMVDDNYFELMIAYYFGNKPRIYIIRSAWVVPFSSALYFATSGIAGDFANYILKEHTVPEMDKNLASVIAIKTVKDAIDYVEGCGLPIRLALVHKPYRQRPFKVVAKKGNEHLAVSIGEKVYGEVEVVPSSIQIYEPEKIEGITEIISKVERETRDARNDKFHKAIQDQSKAYFKKIAKGWAKFCKTHPDVSEAMAKHIEETSEAFELLPDAE
jgi:20S proteasome alpha/beta subunit